LWNKRKKWTADFVQKRVNSLALHNAYKKINGINYINVSDHYYFSPRSKPVIQVLNRPFTTLSAYPTKTPPPTFGGTSSKVVRGKPVSRYRDRDTQSATPKGERKIMHKLQGFFHEVVHIIDCATEFVDPVYCGDKFTLLSPAIGNPVFGATLKNGERLTMAFIVDALESSVKIFVDSFGSKTLFKVPASKFQDFINRPKCAANEILGFGASF